MPGTWPTPPPNLRVRTSSSSSDVSSERARLRDLHARPERARRDWNAGAERIKGYRADEIIGRHFSLFYTEEDRARGQPEHELEVATRDGRFEEEGWRVRKDGTRSGPTSSITAIRDEDGKLVGFAKVTRDLTEQAGR